MKLLVQKINRETGKPLTMVPALVTCGDIHSYIDENINHEIVITICSVYEYDEADVRKDEPCHPA
jgi:hypothetical protein